MKIRIKKIFVIIIIQLYMFCNINMQDVFALAPGHNINKQNLKYQTLLKEKDQIYNNINNYKKLLNDVKSEYSVILNKISLFNKDIEKISYKYKKYKTMIFFVNSVLLLGFLISGIVLFFVDIAIVIPIVLIVLGIVSYFTVWIFTRFIVRKIQNKNLKNIEKLKKINELKDKKTLISKQINEYTQKIKNEKKNYILQEKILKNCNRLKQEEAERLKQEKERLKQEEEKRLKQEEAERLKQEEAERLKQENKEKIFDPSKRILKILENEEIKKEFKPDFNKLYKLKIKRSCPFLLESSNKGFQSYSFKCNKCAVNTKNSLCDKCKKGIKLDVYQVFSINKKLSYTFVYLDNKEYENYYKDDNHKLAWLVSIQRIDEVYSGFYGLNEYRVEIDSSYYEPAYTHSGNNYRYDLKIEENEIVKSFIESLTKDNTNIETKKHMDYEVIDDGTEWIEKNKLNIYIENIDDNYEYTDLENKKVKFKNKSKDNIIQELLKYNIVPKYKVEYNNTEYLISMPFKKCQDYRDMFVLWIRPKHLGENYYTRIYYDSKSHAECKALSHGKHYPNRTKKRYYGKGYDENSVSAFHEIGFILDDIIGKETPKEIQEKDFKIIFDDIVFYELTSCNMLRSGFSSYTAFGSDGYFLQEEFFLANGKKIFYKDISFYEIEEGKKNKMKIKYKEKSIEIKDPKSYGSTMDEYIFKIKILNDFSKKISSNEKLKQLLEKNKKEYDCLKNIEEKLEKCFFKREYDFDKGIKKIKDIGISVKQMLVYEKELIKFLDNIEKISSKINYYGVYLDDKTAKFYNSIFKLFIFIKIKQLESQSEKKSENYICVLKNKKLELSSYKGIKHLENVKITIKKYQEDVFCKIFNELIEQIKKINDFMLKQKNKDEGFSVEENCNIKKTFDSMIQLLESV